jgi:hypothetical protein
MNILKSTTKNVKRKKKKVPRIFLYLNAYLRASKQIISFSESVSIA